MSMYLGEVPFPSWSWFLISCTLVRNLLFVPWFLVWLGQSISYWRIHVQQKLMNSGSGSLRVQNHRAGIWGGHPPCFFQSRRQTRKQQSMCVWMGADASFYDTYTLVPIQSYFMLWSNCVQIWVSNTYLSGTYSIHSGPTYGLSWRTFHVYLGSICVMWLVGKWQD